ncbi:uncharacterized protein [Dermacentor albipictus]|uniref:uncharacterized protein n=1 Tax=Dermacentor albipictus TaxID=60249 RepID=UPI0031FC212B
MNTTRGIVSDADLMELTEAELLESCSDQNVINVKRIKIRRDGKEIETKHLILAFASSMLPETIETGYIKIRVSRYIPNPFRCLTCQRFGHSSQNGQGRQTCAVSSAQEHPSDNCENAPHCVNCEVEHAAYLRTCPSWKKEKEIVRIEVKENISVKEVRRRAAYLPKNSFVELTHQVAAPQRPPAVVLPTHSEVAVTPSTLSGGCCQGCSAAPAEQAIYLWNGGLKGFVYENEAFTSNAALARAHVQRIARGDEHHNQPDGATSA